MLTAQLEDCVGSGFDQGYMAPAGDMPSDDAKAQSFSLASMVQQGPELNQKAWNKIEQATRKYAARAPGNVFNGPAFTGQARTIGPNRVWVPSFTWTVVYTPSTVRAWASR